MEHMIFKSLPPVVEGHQTVTRWPPIYFLLRHCLLFLKDVTAPGLPSISLQHFSCHNSWWLTIHKGDNFSTSLCPFLELLSAVMIWPLPVSADLVISSCNHTPISILNIPALWPPHLIFPSFLPLKPQSNNSPTHLYFLDPSTNFHYPSPSPLCPDLTSLPRMNSVVSDNLADSVVSHCLPSLTWQNSNSLPTCDHSHAAELGCRKHATMHTSLRIFGQNFKLASGAVVLSPRPFLLLLS